MKKKIANLLLCSLVLCMNFSCSEPPITEPKFDKPPAQTDLDKWLYENFVTPYNIQVRYEWKEYEVSMSRYLTPPQLENVRSAMEVVKKTWIEPYEELAEGVIKRYAPRIIVLSGGLNINPSGNTRTLALAEGGRKFTLFELDEIDVKNRVEVSQFMHTIHHEYAHILNQTKPFDEQSYKSITPGTYTAQWYNVTMTDARLQGYIRPYAMSEESEDFAEMVATMFTHNKAEFDALIKNISSTQAKTDLRKKEALVVSYFSEAYGIDVYALQQKIYEATVKITK